MTVTLNLSVDQAVVVAGILGEHQSPRGYNQCFQVYSQLLDNLPGNIREEILGLPGDATLVGREWPKGLTNLVQKVSK